MSKNQLSTRISPEGLEIANAYLELGSIPAVCTRLQIGEAKASEYLAKRERSKHMLIKFILILDIGTALNLPRH